MPINPDTREQVRLSLLRYLDAAAAGAPGRGIPTAVLRQHLRGDGWDIDLKETEAELLYLADKGLVMPAAKRVSPEMLTWRITAEGRDEYAKTVA